MIRSALRGAVLSLLLCVATTSAQQRAVWKLGEFDESGAEFNAEAVPASSVYVVSESRPQDWPRTQPAVTPDRASAESARRIRFALAEAPRGLYRLRLGLIVHTPRLPVVQVEVNGHRGWFYQRFESDFHEGRREAAILPQYAAGTLTIDIPAEFLRQGANELALTALTDPLSTALPGGRLTEDAALSYDALELDGEEGAPAPAAVSGAVLSPTVFYRQEGGRLSEVVSVLVRWSGLRPRGRLTLAVPGWNQSQSLVSDNEFGEQRLEFLVPEFAAGTHAELTVEANERRYQFAQTLVPARKWTVYLVPHEHLDVGYSDYQTKLAELHSRVIDEALAMTDEHPEFRFSLDGYWQAQQFLEGRTEAERRRFEEAVGAHKLFVPAQHSVMLTGFPTAETLLRSFYGAHRFNREHGGPWNYVNITDVPSYSWSYASVLAASGIRYFSAAANADRGPTLMLGDLHRRSPFWWEGPDGSRVLVWYARHYHQIRSEFGLPPVVATGYEGLASFLSTYERPDYTPDAVLLHGSQWENTSLYPQQAALVADWSRLFAYPALRYAGFGEALEQIAARARGELPVVRGDGGPYWEDGVASDAYYAAVERANERRAVSAEKLATVAALVDRRTAPSRETLRCVWDNILLMNEHTWGWGRSVTEPHSEDSTRELAFKRERAVAARACVESVLERAMTAIAGRLETPPRALVVFNTLNWARDGWVEFDLQKTRELVELETGRAVEFEVLRDEPAYQRIRFMARAVPAMGYRTYTVRERSAVAAVVQPGTAIAARPGAAVAGQPRGATVNKSGGAQPDASTSAASSAAANSSAPAQVSAPAETLENSFYRVRLDAASGAVRSIYDKQLGRELVDQSSPLRFDQYVYVTGGDDFPNQLLTYRRSSPLARLSTHTGTEGRIVSVSRTPTGTVARLESRGLNTLRISTEIVLFDDQKKIEFNHRVLKHEVFEKEAIYFAFPLAVREPQFHYEVQNGVVDPARDMMPGAGREWFSAQNWVAVGEPGLSVAIVNRDSFLWTFGDIVRGTWPTEFGRRGATAFSYVMNNYWNTNYVAAQGGEFTFRYVLTSARELDGAALSRLGWEETTPLERTLVKAQDKAAPVRDPLPGPAHSFLEVSDPSVLLSAWKLAEDGTGSVMRFIELGGAPRRTVRVRVAAVNSPAAEACDAMEECAGRPLASGPDGFSFDLAPRQIYTVRLRPARD